jgi:hypothetical protein
MPAHFSVHVDPDDLARRDLAAAVPLPDIQDRRADTAHHGGRDERLAARRQSERSRSARAAGRGPSRSYAFRRS